MSSDSGFEIFPWTPTFETGIAVIDVQHRRLLGLCNELGRALSQDASEPDVA